MATFSQYSRLTGALRAELLERGHLHIEVRKPFRKPYAFTVDSACLAPALSMVTPEGIVAFGLATVFAIAFGSLALYGLAMNELLPAKAWLAVALVAWPLSAALAVAFRHRSLHRLAIRTRCAGVALLVEPILPNKRRDMESFLSLLRARIGEAETKRGLTAERLRSGEIKTLRRLTQEKVIPIESYETAKQVILNL